MHTYNIFMFHYSTCALNCIFMFHCKYHMHYIFMFHIICIIFVYSRFESQQERYTMPCNARSLPATKLAHSFTHAPLPPDPIGSSCFWRFAPYLTPCTLVPACFCCRSFCLESSCIHLWLLVSMHVTCKRNPVSTHCSLTVCAPPQERTRSCIPRHATPNVGPVSLVPATQSLFDATGTKAQVQHICPCLYFWAYPFRSHVRTCIMPHNPVSCRTTLYHAAHRSMLPTRVSPIGRVIVLEYAR